MDVAIVNYVYEPGHGSIERLLARYFMLTGWAEGLVAAGARVTVYQRYAADADIERGGVRYRLVADGLPPLMRSRQLPLRLHRLVRAARPALLHLNGLLYPLQARALRAALPAGSRLMAQHHAEQPWPGPRGALQRWGLRAADGFLFAAAELAASWRQRGMIRPSQPVYTVMEGSSWFRPGDRAAARASLGLAGEPLLLWVGRLDANKDPLTVLAGFELALARLPGARLAMAYGEAGLEPQVRARIAASPALAGAVTLLGRLPHADMAAHYHCADLFVLGSHYEGGGVALIESLACGLTPVVSDIPSFRVLCDGGRLGALWPVGDHAALAEAIVAAAGRPQPAAVRQFFERQLSFPSLGRQALAAYANLAARGRPR